MVVPNSKKDVFLCTFDVNYETGEYSTKALNSKNEEIFTDYNKIEAIQNSDENNELWYEDNVLKVQKDGKWGSVDSKGNVVIEPTYNLDNYLLVNFIGRWHLGQDINMNYYNQLD